MKTSQVSDGSQRGAAMHMERALSLAQRGDFASAIAGFREAIECDPSFAPAHHNFGVALAEQGNTGEAIESFGRAIELRPDYVAAHLNLAGVLSTTGRKYDAVDHYRRVLELQPDSADALNGLGLAMTELGRPGEAAVCLKQAIRLRPDMAEAHNNLGLALVDLARYSEAEAAYEQALRFDPRYIEAHTNLGTAYSQQGRFQEGIACYQVALWIKPDAVSTHWNRSLAWLTQGNYGQGWPEYEWRWKRKKSPMRPFDQPMWDGSDLAGKTILLWPEQGLGDAIQFIRYAALVKQRGGNVLFECPGPLTELLGSCASIDQLLVDTTAPFGRTPFDVHVPLMNLPSLFRTTLKSIPATVPYLRAEHSRVKHWRQKLQGAAEVKIGIAWQGNPHHQWDRYRSLPLSLFEPIAKLPGVRLFSLQRGPGTEQLAALGNRFPVTDLMNSSHPDAIAWREVAAAMECLDLVISVDTATAHLAGALGKPVWVALSKIVDWRWMLDREDSPWYPTMRLFRQREIGRWEEVFERMATELRKSTVRQS